MRKEGQNALLKTIEEPPEYAVIILIVKNKELLLQTIRSRCISLSFRAEPEFQTDDEAAAFQFSRIEGILSGQETRDMEELIKYAKELSTEYTEYLPDYFSYIEGICRDALLMKSGILLTEKPAAGYIGKASAISYEGLEQVLNAVKRARHDLLINVAAETVMDSLLLTIVQVTAKSIG